MKSKLITREEMRGIKGESKRRQAYEVAKEENFELYQMTSTPNVSKAEFEELFKKGTKPSEQLIEVLFYWIEDKSRRIFLSDNKRILKLFIKYEAYKPTLRELIKYC